MPDSENSASESNASESNDGESRQSAATQIEEIAALLAEPEPGAKASDDDGDSEKASESGTEPPKTINEFAERHKVDVKDLYKLQFNFGDDGESKTLGEMKDIAANAGQLEVDRLTFEETKATKETAFVRANAELQELIGMLPKSAVTPQLLKVIAEKRAGIVEREKGLTLDHIPEWKDSDRETTDRTKMREHLAAYGFGANYLDSVNDHKTLKYIRDNMNRQARIDRVLAQVKQVSKPGHKPSAKPGKPAAPARAGQKVRTVDSQVSQVAELLRNAS